MDSITLGVMIMRNTPNSKYILVLSLLMLSHPVWAAGSGSNVFSVTASVGQICSISTTTPLAFALYDPVGSNATVPLNATGQISIACSKGAFGLTIGMSDGIHALGSQRQMLGGTSSNSLQYNIVQPSSNLENAVCSFPGSIPWNSSGAGLLTLTSAPANTARVYNVCGTIPAGQDVSVDSYTDIVTASINF